MNMKYSYAREKLFAAVEILATFPGDVRSRISRAYHEFHPLTEEHFPDELKNDWKWVTKSITKYGPKYNYKGDVSIGSVDNTMSRIKNKTGAKVADKIFSLYYELHHSEKYL